MMDIKGKPSLIEMGSLSSMRPALPAEENIGFSNDISRVHLDNENLNVSSIAQE